MLLRAFVRLRRSALLEIALLGGIVVAVAILTELRPGRDTPAASAAAVPVAPRPPTLPPKGAVVDAHELGTLAVAVARTPGSAMVTLLGPDGTGVDGRTVEIDGTSTTSCGAGCYRAPAASGPIHVSVDGRNVTFTVPARAPDATKLLATVTRRYRRSHTIVFDEHLASSPTNGETTRFQMEAPHNLSYTIHSGPAAIVIGTRRWDRERPGAPFVESSQTPLDVTQPYWHTTTNAHEVEPGVITFLDRSIPAWFRVTLHGTVPARTEMTATAHFMVDRYVGFDGPVTISPPPSR